MPAIIKPRQPLTQAHLNQAAKEGCQNPHCKHEHENRVYLSGNCRKGAGVKASYLLNSGVLNITCAVCGNHIVDIGVATP